MPHALDDPPFPEPRVLSSRNLELIMAANLVHSAHPKLRGFEVGWKQQQRQELSPEAARFLAFAEEGLEWATLSLCDYIPLSGIQDDWPELRAYLEDQPIEEFLFVALNCDIPRTEIASLRQEPGRAIPWASRLSCFSRMKPEALVKLLSDPEDFRRQLLAFLEGNRTSAFETRLQERRPKIEQRIKAVQARLKGQDPIAVAEELTGKPFKYPRDFRTYTFAPCHFIGPKHFYSWGEGNFLLAFSLGQTEETDADRSRQLSDRMKILGDRTRLDILHLLKEGPSYGKAIADRLELTTATVSRQLDQLKEAGLVTEDRADSTNIKLVHLKGSALQELLGEVQGFLGSRKD
jgi:DNA-binding transcriptional ArsR family regulator